MPQPFGLEPFAASAAQAMLDEVSDVVTNDPEIMSGESCFAGTRVPVKNLIDYLAAGDSLDKFLDSFPTVSFVPYQPEWGESVCIEIDSYLHALRD